MEHCNDLKTYSNFIIKKYNHRGSLFKTSRWFLELFPLDVGYTLNTILRKVSYFGKKTKIKIEMFVSLCLWSKPAIKFVLNNTCYVCLLVGTLWIPATFSLVHSYIYKMSSLIQIISAFMMEQLPLNLLEIQLQLLNVFNSF